MKKNLLTLAFLGFTYFANAQVGIDTNTPQATLDIKEKRTSNVNDVSAHDGILIPKVTKAELALKDTNAYTSIQNGAIIYVPNIGGAITGPSLAQVANVDAIGFYYLDASTSTIVWRKLDTNTNLYNVNGTLIETRIVTQNGNTLMFTDGIARDVTSKTNSIIFGQTSATDANPTMVLASGARKVGINTKSPRVSFDINGALSATSAAAEGLLIPKMTASELSKKELNTYQARGTHSNNTGQGSLEGTLVYIFPDSDNNFIISPTDPSYTKVKEVTKEGLYYYGIDDKWHPVSSTSTNFYTANGTLTGPRVVTQGTNTLAFTGTTTNAFSVDGTTFSVDAANDRIGIGTNAPSNTLHVKATSNPTKFEGLQEDTSVQSVIVTGTDGVLKTIPKSSLLNDVTNFTMPIIRGTFNSSLGTNIDIATKQFTTANPYANPVPLDATINLPKGTWEVKVTMLMRGNNSINNYSSSNRPAYIYTKFAFCTTASGCTAANGAGSSRNFLLAGTLIGAGSKITPSGQTDEIFTLVNGSIIVKNSSETNQTYYLYWWGANTNIPTTTTNTYLITSLGNNAGENSISAIRITDM
ncbi:hypothetical protein [Empedobacter tilapiae]|uniref:Uncharacterized protein n=1 Tax=Empedobacter tilapiae TaxID=2491114 RepID=A0A4Z1BGZ2_9FLAO|nr:hypothetical protein [Empedobacter tilapiae]TGN24289.1 hypothetical protein E4J94_13670 [Empedobacter tilapiae]